MRPRLAAALSVASAVLLALGAGIPAFSAAPLGARSDNASVVGTGAAYDAVQTVRISASTLLGYSNQLGVRVYNNGTVATTFTWTTTSDPNNVEQGVTNCAANTAVGASCAIRFSGPALLTGSYTFTGRVNGVKPAQFRSEVPGIVVTVAYCPLPPCA